MKSGVALSITVLCALIAVNEASLGDRTPFFHNCRRHCERQNCTDDGIGFQEQAVKYYQQTVFDRLLMWTCADECMYGCMFRTVELYLERGWPVPQFYGKWPFVRALGLQEPASVLFSAINLITHFRSLRKFRRFVHPESPGYKLVHIFAFTCFNGWLCSIIFHARDYALTELLDYVSAYSIMLCSLYFMVMRMLHRQSSLLRGALTIGFVAYFLKYFASLFEELGAGTLNYSNNMQLNVATAALSAAGWFVWCYFVRQRRPYYRQIVRFYVLLGFAASMELLDFPPFYYVLDAHAMWHLATIALVPLLYGFFIEDCTALYREQKLTRMPYSDLR